MVPAAGLGGAALSGGAGKVAIAIPSPTDVHSTHVRIIFPLSSYHTIAIIIASAAFAQTPVCPDRWHGKQKACVARSRNNTGFSVFFSLLSILFF